MQSIVFLLEYSLFTAGTISKNVANLHDRKHFDVRCDILLLFPVSCSNYVLTHCYFVKMNFIIKSGKPELLLKMMMP